MDDDVEFQARQPSSLFATLWSHAHCIQAGLESILAPLRERNASAEELDATKAQAYAFYSAHKASTDVPTTPIATPDGPAPLSFSDLAERIAKGEEIQGIKQIEDKLNEEEPSQPKLAGQVEGAGRKPWEQV